MGLNDHADTLVIYKYLLQLIPHWDILKFWSHPTIANADTKDALQPDNAHGFGTVPG